MQLLIWFKSYIVLIVIFDSRQLSPVVLKIKINYDGSHIVYFFHNCKKKKKNLEQFWYSIQKTLGNICKKIIVYSNSEFNYLQLFEYLL